MKTWVIERRRLEDDDASPPWEAYNEGETLQEAARRYNELIMCIKCHEQRLLDPDGAVVLHHRDQRGEASINLSPPSWRDRWHDLLTQK